MIDVYARITNSALEKNLGIHLGFDPTGWTKISAPSLDAVYVDSSGNITTYTQAEMDAKKAQEALQSEAMTLLKDIDANTIPRILAATVLGKTSKTTPDVVAFMNQREAVRAIAMGTDTTSTVLPTVVYPANT